MGTNTPHTCIPGLVWQKQARRLSQFELKVGELRFPIHFVCVSAALYHRGVRGRHFSLRWIWPIGQVPGKIAAQQNETNTNPGLSFCEKRKLQVGWQDLVTMASVTFLSIWYGLRNSQRPHCRITARLCLASPISKHTSLHQVAGFGTKRVQTGLASTTTLLTWNGARY